MPINFPQSSVGHSVTLALYSNLCLTSSVIWLLCWCVLKPFKLFKFAPLYATDFSSSQKSTTRLFHSHVIVTRTSKRSKTSDNLVSRIDGLARWASDGQVWFFKCMNLFAFTNQKTQNISWQNKISLSCYNSTLNELQSCGRSLMKQINCDYLKR